MPVRITNNSSTGAAYTSNIASGITWAADHGADLLNREVSGAELLAVVTVDLDVDETGCDPRQRGGGALVVDWFNLGDDAARDRKSARFRGVVAPSQQLHLARRIHDANLRVYLPCDAGIAPCSDP